MAPSRTSLIYLFSAVVIVHGRPETRGPPSQEEVSVTIWEKENPPNVNYQILGDPEVCGFSSKGSGSGTPRRDFPWMAFITYGEETQAGGGSVITPRHVLTAAHLFFGYPEDIMKKFIVQVGHYNVKTPSEVQRFGVEDARVHKDYDPNRQFNDIAILLLKGRIVYNLLVQPVCLPMPGENYEGKTAVASGWGNTRYNGTTSDILKSVELPIWNNNECRKGYNTVEKITDSHLCAAGYQGGEDACKFDSGGPLSMRRKDGRWMIIGVVSWGYRCALKNYPGIYTRVDKYLDWIAANIQED